MEETVPLGRVAGVRIGANWSLLLVFWLIAWSLADAQLPHGAPHHSSAAYWMTAVVATAAFYACLLAHELAHAVVARRSGMVVEGIVLWLFGGVSRLKGEAATARTELRVALAGPATSLGLGLAFWALTVAIDGHVALLAAAIGWLGWVNAVLAVFNLAPAFPLDGGRVLRAVLWQRSGDKAAATATAGRAGSAFGYLLMAFGLLAFFGGAGVGGLWLVFLGWFVFVAARSEAASSALESELGSLTAADVMTRHPIVAPATATVDRLLDEWVYPNRCSTFPIVGTDGELVGLVTLRRLKRVAPPDRATTTAAEVACPIDEVVTCTPDEALVPVVRRMAGSPDQRALVLHDGHLVGIISPTDVTRAHEHAQLRR